MTDSNQNMQTSDEMTLKELILLIQEYWGVLWRKKWYIIAAGLIGGLIFGIIEYQKPVTYTAELTFMVNEEEGNRLGVLGGLAASFGIGGGSGGEYNLEKMLSLLKSRAIIQDCLLKEVALNGKNDYLANHIIEIYNFHEDKWFESEDLKRFVFTKNSFDEFGYLENSAIKDLRKLIIGLENKAGLLNGEINVETGIISLKIKSISEELSLKLSTLLFEKLSSYYVNKTIEKQSLTLDITKMKTDSLLANLEYYESMLLKYNDSRKNIVLQQNTAQSKKLERNYQIALVAYSEALKNYEIADFALKVSTPIVQVIDAPVGPLNSNKNLFKYLNRIISGAALGVMLLVTYFIFLKIFKDALE